MLACLKRLHFLLQASLQLVKFLPPIFIERLHLHLPSLGVLRQLLPMNFRPQPILVLQYIRL
jgi:hypothetical protein